MATEKLDPKATQKKLAEQLYNDGSTIYDIAKEVFGFDSDEAVVATKKLLGLDDLL